MPYYNEVLITKCVMCLNPKQVDKTNKTLLDLRAVCVRERVKLQEAKSNPETRPVNCQVSNA